MKHKRQHIINIELKLSKMGYQYAMKALYMQMLVSGVKVIVLCVSTIHSDHVPVTPLC